MNPIVVLILFAGLLLTMHGIMEEKVRAIEKHVRIEYRFLPRTLYEEQMGAADVMGKFKTMFDGNNPGSGYDSQGRPSTAK